jgi:hypothetical protein
MFVLWAKNWICDLGIQSRDLNPSGSSLRGAQFAVKFLWTNKTEVFIYCREDNCDWEKQAQSYIVRKTERAGNLFQCLARNINAVINRILNGLVYWTSIVSHYYEGIWHALSDLVQTRYKTEPAWAVSVLSLSCGFEIRATSRKASIYRIMSYVSPTLIIKLLTFHGKVTNFRVLSSQIKQVLFSWLPSW